VSAQKRIVSSDSTAVPDGQPETEARRPMSWSGVTPIGSAVAPTTSSLPSTPRPSTTAVITSLLGAVARITRAPPMSLSAWAASAARLSM
jgi:hypothetical protein